MKFLKNLPVDTPPDRIKFIRKSLQISQTKMANLMGISQGTLSQIENGRYDVSFESLLKLSEAHNINCNWIILGKEGVFRTDVDTAEKKSELSIFDKNRERELDEEAGKKGIPLVEAEAIAGYIKNYDQSSFLEKLELFKVPGFENHGDHRIFQVDGDSMEPTLSTNDYLICEFCGDKSEIQNGDVKVIVSEEAVLVKRIYLYEEDKSFYVLKSDNPEYESQILEIAKINEIWHVRGKITTEFDKIGQSKEGTLENMQKEMDDLKTKVALLMKLNSNIDRAG